MASNEILAVQCGIAAESEVSHAHCRSSYGNELGGAVQDYHGRCMPFVTASQ